MDALRRDRLPDDLAPLLRHGGIDGTITVQVRQSEAQTESLLGQTGLPGPELYLLSGEESGG